MKPEDKQLLLSDLSARLPYEPIVEYVLKAFGGGNATMTCTLDTLHLEDLLQDSEDLVHIKPYLRPLSTMTEEEIIEFNNIPSTKNYTIIENDLPWDVAHYKQIDWLNKKMFDFRGLIPKGLAISTKEFNPYKK